MYENPEDRPAEEKSGAPLQPQDTAAMQAPPKRSPNPILWGPHGIRAGWAVLIFAAIIAGLAVIVRLVAMHFLHPPHKVAILTPGLAATNEGIMLGMLAIAVFAMSRIECKPFLYYGYQGRARAGRFLFGLLWGFVAITALVLTLWKLGLASLSGPTLNEGSALRYAVEWGGMFVMVGFFEESFLRGYLQYTVGRGLGFWWAALMLSFLFGFGHHSNPGESPIGLVSAGAIGLVFCVSLWYTGSLWWAVGFHAAWDWGETYFYGTADSGLQAKGHLLNEHAVGSILWSGGATGPEGSILILPLIAIIAALMFLWWGRRERSPWAGAGWRPPRAENRPPEAEITTAGN